jgi:hypothetical protein
MTKKYDEMDVRSFRQYLLSICNKKCGGYCDEMCEKYDICSIKQTIQMIDHYRFMSPNDRQI